MRQTEWGGGKHGSSKLPCWPASPRASCAFRPGSLITSEPGSWMADLISLSSLEGAALAAAQPAAAPMWTLLAHFETQHTQSFCSIATAAMLLNALGVPRPIDPAYAPYPYFTQANVLGECALAKPVTANKHRAGGDHISVTASPTQIPDPDPDPDPRPNRRGRCTHAGRIHRHTRRDTGRVARLRRLLASPLVNTSTDTGGSQTAPAPHRFLPFPLCATTTTHPPPPRWLAHSARGLLNTRRPFGFRPAPVCPSGRDRG